MNDLDLLRTLQDDLAPRDAPPPTAIRRRLMDEAARTAIRPLTFRRPTRSSRWLLPAGASVAAAALLVAVAVAHRPSGDSGPGPVRTSPVTAANSRDTGEVDVRLNAGTILLAAATTAREHEEKAPEATAFIYNRSKETGVNPQADGGVRFYSDEREAWISADGSRVGAVTPSGDTELVLLRSSCEHAGSPECRTVAGYAGDAPTSAKAMLAYLKQGETDPDLVPGTVMHGAQDLLMERMAPAKVRAAVFEALATLPDVTVVTGATNALGQKGTSISVVDSSSNSRLEVMFDEGHQLIGTRDVTLAARPGIPAGTVEYSHTRLVQAVVPTLGLRPDGTTRRIPPHSLWDRVFERMVG